MRSILTSLLLFLISISNAQNWAPIDRNEKFNFSQSGLNYISNTIWVDSAGSMGQDSVFYLNRIVTNCDTCPASFKLCNQPGFLKKQMYKLAGGKYEFRLPGQLIRTMPSINRRHLRSSRGSYKSHVE